MPGANYSLPSASYIGQLALAKYISTPVGNKKNNGKWSDLAHANLEGFYCPKRGFNARYAKAYDRNVQAYASVFNPSGRAWCINLYNDFRDAYATKEDCRARLNPFSVGLSKVIWLADAKTLYFDGVNAAVSTQRLVIWEDGSAATNKDGYNFITPSHNGRLNIVNMDGCVESTTLETISAETYVPFATGTLGNIKEVHELLIALTLETLCYVVHDRTCGSMYLLDKARVLAEITILGDSIDLLAEATGGLKDCKIFELFSFRHTLN